MLTYHCDRCKKKIDGDEGANFTSGFYYVTSGYWNRFARPYETVVCDDCMWADPDYIAIYGTHRPKPGI